jgi:gluconate 5-dehydrogenase
MQRLGNAGVNAREDALKCETEAFIRVLNINLNAVFACSKAVGAIMKDQHKGKIINMASIAGLVATPKGVGGNVAYHCSKTAVIGLTRQLASEWGEYNINVNAICPNVIATDMNRDIINSKAYSLLFSDTNRIP